MIERRSELQRWWCNCTEGEGRGDEIDTAVRRLTVSAEDREVQDCLKNESIVISSEGIGDSSLEVVACRISNQLRKMLIKCRN